MSSHVRVFRTLTEIDGFSGEWRRLQWHPNSDLDYYRTVLQSMPADVSPYVLALFRDDIVQAILAGRVETSRIGLRIGYAHLPAPRTRQLIFVHGGLLGDPTPAECTQMVDHIHASMRSGEVDFLRFNHLRTDSVLYPLLAQICSRPPRKDSSVLQIHRAMTLPRTEDEFWQRFAPKIRKNLKWQMKRFERGYNGNLRIRCMGAPHDFERMVTDIERIAQKTYQRALGAGFSATLDERSRLRYKSERGWLRGYVLYAGEVPCSFWCGTLYRGVFHSESMGYDQAFQQFSPGMHLILRVIELLCREGEKVSMIDFGLGDAQYKRLLGDIEWQDGSPCGFAPTFSGLTLRAYCTPVFFLDSFARRLLPENFRTRLKRLWRERIRYASSPALRVSQEMTTSRDELTQSTLSSRGPKASGSGAR